jgi:hypothetical protein
MDFEEAINGDGEQGRRYESFERHGEDSWLTLWSSWGNWGDRLTGGSYSGLVATGAVPKLLAGFGWDVRIDGHRPGFSVSYGGDRERVTYAPVGWDGVEPIVHVRPRIKRFPRSFVLAQELVLLFDLRRGADGHWYWIDDAGDEQMVITFAPDIIQAQRWVIRRFQAVRQLALELTIESDVTDAVLASLGAAKAELRTETSAFSYYRGQLIGPDGRWYSRLLGKQILLPPPIEQCGFWPYKDADRHESFAIDVDDLGRPVEYSSDPDGLANYFGANPQAPNYVTPVTFRREVLEKYYRAPDEYSIEDGYLRRGGFWGMRIDNDSPDVVTVMLGDLGRDLPHSEQKYWKSFNIAGRGRFSETAFRRGFLAEFADSASLDLQFRRLYPDLNLKWSERFGWPLFREPVADDAQILSQVRLLPDDQQAAFDDQILRLAKLTVDALNEEALVAAVGLGPDDEKGISKLQRFLDGLKVQTADTIVSSLRSVQEIRSAGTAHWKGRKYEKLRAAAASSDRRQWFAEILQRAVVALEELRAVAIHIAQ